MCIRDRYKNLTSGGILLDEYEAGDIFKIGNKEYVLSESHTSVSYTHLVAVRKLLRKLESKAQVCHRLV